jgi:tellurite resistance protein TehA-like permease
MGSGIISVGLRLEGFDALSAALMWICAASFAVLGVLTTARLVRYRAEILDDFTDPRRGFGFFTLVAGANVLGVRLSMDGHLWWTGALLTLAVVLWVVLGYVVPWTAVLGRSTRPVVELANGTWFVWVVASQSIAVAPRPCSLPGSPSAARSRSWRSSRGRSGSSCMRRQEFSWPCA